MTKRQRKINTRIIIASLIQNWVIDGMPADIETDKSEALKIMDQLQRLTDRGHAVKNQP